jgi:succinate-acetate transporter protein
MTKFKKYRLVLACANVLGGVLRLIAALVNMASNYFYNATEMDTPVRA